MMKKLTYILLALSGLSAPTAKAIGTYKQGDVLHVFARSGLSLRETPSVNGKKIGSIANGEAVTVLDMKEKDKPAFDFEIAPDYKVSGHWVHITSGTPTKKMEGYILDHYLSHLNSPTENDAANDDRDMFESFYTGTSAPTGDRKSIKDNDTTVNHYTQAFKDGTMLEVFEQTGSSTRTLTFRTGANMTLEEAFLGLAPVVFDQKEKLKVVNDSLKHKVEVESMEPEAHFTLTIEQHKGNIIARSNFID